jgi:hypothetical protein
MSQRTDRRVSGPLAQKEGKKMTPKVEAMPMGDGAPSDCSDANDGSKASKAVPANSHVGPKG